MPWQLPCVQMTCRSLACRAAQGVYTTKWFDTSTSGTTTLTLELSDSDGFADAYQLHTADDSIERDPISWTASCSYTGSITDTRTSYAAPTVRYASYELPSEGTLGTCHSPPPPPGLPPGSYPPSAPWFHAGPAVATASGPTPTSWQDDQLFSPTYFFGSSTSWADVGPELTFALLEARGALVLVSVSSAEHVVDTSLDFNTAFRLLVDGAEVAQARPPRISPHPAPFHDVH